MPSLRVFIVVAGLLPVLPPSRLPAQSYFQQDIHYTIGASLDEPSGVLTGAAQLVYRNNSRDTLREIYFHLYLNAFRPGSLWSQDERREGIQRFADLPDPWHAFERLGRVTIGDVPVTPSFPHNPDSTIVRFDLPRALVPGDSLVVQLEWTARPSAIPRRQGRRGRRFDFAQGYPKVCVYDRGGWQAHPLRLAGEFYGEYGTYDVTLDLAEDQVVAATGVPVEGDPGWAGANSSGGPVTLQSDWYPSVRRTTHDARRTLPGRKSVRFYAEKIHHFAWSANPEYRYEEGRYNDVVLRTLYLPEDSATWGGGRVIERTRRAMAWLDTIFGAYPYPQTVVVHRIEGGGTEFPMLVMNGGPQESLIFHEVGHIYTYGILGNNEWREGWLDEGFTTFQTAWNFQRRGMGVPSVVTQQLILNMDLDEWSEPISKVSEGFSEFGIYSRMIYTKGQLFQEMLRYVVGEESFRRGLRLYYDRWKLRHVDEHAYREAMEEASGQSLIEFFQQWLHRLPIVDYKLRRVQRWRDEGGGGGWRAEITVDRVGSGTMPVDIAVPSGDTVYTARVSGTRPRETVRIATPERPGRVELDPARQTMDWNYLNNREGSGILRIFGPVAPKPAHRLGWSGSAPARRDRRVHNWLPLLWHNEAGGVQAGLQWRSNYLGRFDQNAVQLTYGARQPQGSHIWNVWATLHNPHWAKGSRRRWGGDLWFVEGRRGGRFWATMDRSPHLTYGPRVTAGIELLHNSVTNRAYVDTARWSERSVTEVIVSLTDRWPSQGRPTELRLTGGAGVSGQSRRMGLGQPRFYARGTIELRHHRPLSKLEVRGRVFGGGVFGLGRDTSLLPQQRAMFLAGADPYETFANPFLRSRGALFVRPGVNYSAPGGAGARAFQDGIIGDWVAAANAELVLPLFRRPQRRVFSSVSLAAFGDVAGLWRARIAAARLDRIVFADAGLGVRASHRIGPTSFVTRVDVPLAATRVPYPALPPPPIGPPRGADARGRLRFVWSLEEAF